MDSQMFMSVTADVSVRKQVALAPPWISFAPFMEDRFVRELIRKAMAKPQVCLKSRSIEGAELRLHYQDRLGIAGMVEGGEVSMALPFVQFGREYEMEIIKTAVSASGLESWVSAYCLGIELTFCDIFHTLGAFNYEPGDRRRFTLGAFAMSIKRVAATSFPDNLDDGELGLPTRGIRGFVAKGERIDQGIFQSPVESEPTPLHFKERDFVSLPVSLAEYGRERLGIDLVVASELLETLESPIEADDEVAGVLWLHGYCPQPFWSSG